jgi:hypothetical protein
MKSLNLGILACCALGVTASAMADETSPGIFTGRVERTYVRLEPGVFRETTQPRRYAVIWVEVSTDRLEESRSGSALHMIRSEASAERGDIVTFRTADSINQMTPILREARVVAVSAKRDTAGGLAAATVR